MTVCPFCETELFDNVDLSDGREYDVCDEHVRDLARKAAEFRRILALPHVIPQ